ncbi:MAG: DUF3857 and transglutaminase domain-containing protein [Terracidiphilus sp.]
MRVSVLMRSLPLLLVVASPVCLRAQFQQPTAEELKMTADPKAPGAAAVYLNIEETIDEKMHVQSYYARIKVLQEKGKELATVQLPYMQGRTSVADIKARTIHADGTIIPLVGKPDDLLVVKTKLEQGDSVKVGSKVFNLPSVEVGSILEYRYELRMGEEAEVYGRRFFTWPFWVIQRPYFVHDARYTYKPFWPAMPGMPTVIRWWQVLPPGTTLSPGADGGFHLKVADIPAAPDEEHMPPTNGLLYQVMFYYSRANDPAEFWTVETRSWSKNVDHFAETSKPIKEAVAGLVAPGDSDLDKARKLYKAVQALDNTDFSRKKSETERKQLKLKEEKHAEDTWRQKSGDSEDIALLYVALARAAGLTAYDMKVADRSLRVFDPGYFDFDQLDDDIILVTVAGKEILLDPGEKMCPFQTVHWRHSGAMGVRQSADIRGVSTSPLQAYTANTLLRTGDLTLDEHGGITGTLRFVLTGQEALQWRQTALRNDLEEVKKQFDRLLESVIPEGVEAHVDHFLALDDPDANLTAIINVRGAMGAATSKRLLLPGFFFETRSGHPFVDQEKRLEPVDMHYPEQITDEVTYHLPASLSVEGAPQNSKIIWAGHADFMTKSVAAPGKIIVARQIRRAFTLAKPEEYQDLRGFYQKVAAADQAQLVLAKTARSETGN